MSIQKFQGPKWYDSVPSSKYKFFQILSSNLKVLDMVHFVTQMVHILRVYQLKISLSNLICFWSIDYRSQQLAFFTIRDVAEIVTTG